MAQLSIKQKRTKAKANTAAWRKANPARAKASAAAWRKKNPAKAKAWAAAWYKANPARAKASAAAWRKANPARVKANTAAWRKANPARVKANTAAWRKANPARVKASAAAWYKANPAKVKAIARRTVATKRAVTAINPTACFTYLLSGAKTRSKKHNRPFNIDVSYINKLWSAQQGKCKLSGVKMTTGVMVGSPTVVSIDRINSNKGYVKGNCQLVTVTVNMMKQKLSNIQLLAVCKLVANHM